MALTSWKAFPFFSVSKVPVPADEDGTYVFDVSHWPLSFPPATNIVHRTR